MTRKSQKANERGILDQYFKALGLPYTVIEEAEPPDFIVQVGRQRVGVEITEYHVPHRLPGGFTRRAVEDGWERLRSYVVEFRKTHPELDRLSIWLEFTGLCVPSGKELPSFVAAVAALIADTRPSMNDEDGYLYIRIEPDSPAILRSYLKTVRIKKVSCYMEWDWNHSAGGVGTSDQEMLAAVGQKLKGYQPPDGLDANHLVVAGWGGRMSEIIAPLSAEQFQSFTAFNAALEESPFDTVGVLCFLYLLWERGRGWRELPRPHP